MPDLPDPALNRVLVGHDGTVRGCAFAPDGTWLVTVAWDGLRVWHPDSGQLIRLLPGDSSYPITLSPDGSRLACEGKEGTIQIWDTRTWEIRRVLDGHKNWVDSCCYFADGRTLASTGNDDVIRFWDTETGKLLGSSKAPETILASAAMRDGRLLCIDRSGMRIWTSGMGGHINLSPPDVSRPQDVVVSPDQKWAALPGSTALAIYDLTRTHEPPKTLHHGDLTTAAFSPDGAMLATGNDKGLVVLWSTTEWRPVGEIAAHGSRVSELAFSPTGAVLASGGEDGTIRLWDPTRVRADDTRGTRASTDDSCAVAGNGTWLAVRSNSGSITIYNIATWRVQARLSYASYAYTIAAVGNESLAVDQYDGILVTEATNWQMSRKLRHPTELTVNNMSTGGHLVCAVDDRDRVVVWDVETWQPPVLLEVTESGLQTRQDPPNPFVERIRGRLKRLRRATTDVDVEVAPGGEWLAVQVDQVIHVIAPRTWEKITTLRFSTEISEPKAGPGGRWLAVRVGRTIRILNSETWAVEAEIPQPQEARYINDGAWSPDGSLLATVLADGTLRVLDGRDWTVTLTEIRLDGELNACAWLSDHRLVAVGGHGVHWFTYVPG